MNFKKQAGYILFLNLIVICLIALFIPLLIQEQLINYKVLDSRIKTAQLKEAVESGLEYQLYFLKNDKLIKKEKIKLKSKLIVSVEGREDNNFYYLVSFLEKPYSYSAEMKVSKKDLKVIYKKIFRSD